MLFIINKFIKNTYYKLGKIIIEIFGFVEVIIYTIIQYYNSAHLIVSNYSLAFTLKFLSSLCYFHKIMQKLIIIFYPEVDGKTKR